MKKRLIVIGIIACLVCGVSRNIQAVTNVEIKQYENADIENHVGKVDGKILVVYFTVPETDGVDASSGASRVVSRGNLYGNTEYIARIISESTGGELFVLKTEQAYPGTHTALVNAAKKESEAQVRPRLSTHIRNLKDYDVIFVGYPNWWYDMPMPLYSFFDEYDFSGKIIIPFCTHGGSRFSQSVETIAQMESGAKVVRGPAIPARNVPDARENIVKWLQGQGFRTNGK